MATRLRMESPAAAYHAMLRGSGQRRVAGDEADRQMRIAWLPQTVKTCNRPQRRPPAARHIDNRPARLFQPPLADPPESALP